MLLLFAYGHKWLQLRLGLHEFDVTPCRRTFEEKKVQRTKVGNRYGCAFEEKMV